MGPAPHFLGGLAHPLLFFEFFSIRCIVKSKSLDEKIVL